MPGQVEFGVALGCRVTGPETALFATSAIEVVVQQESGKVCLALYACAEFELSIAESEAIG